jgi:hypothetical protein
VRRLFALVLLSGCNVATPIVALHDLHQGTTQVNVPSLTDDFYALPFPNDVRLEADGSIDLRRYPRLPGILTDYVETIDKEVRGAGPNAGMFFRFDGPLDHELLPEDAAASVDPAASVFIVDVTPGSPTYGKRMPFRARYTAVSYDVIGPYWLALLPFPGVALRQKTTYAAVLTDKLKSKSGGDVLRALDFGAAMRKDTSDPRIAEAVTKYAPFMKWLDGQPGLADHVVNATVFTTVDATSVMKRLRDAVYAQPAPTLQNLADAGDDKAGINHLYEGTYDSPNFQQGDPPYSLTGQGGIRYDAQGNPELARTENLRVLISLPVGPMPANGWPIVLYAHGTGGNYKSFIRDGSAVDAAHVVDKNGQLITQMAMISIDQVLHGPRVPEGTNEELAFFNFPNIVAFHDNPKQGALDDFQLLRLVKSIDIAQAPGTGVPIKFDPDRIYFKGHSQGGLTGPLFLAYEPEVKAAVLSGAGGVLIYSLLNKLEPVNIPHLVGVLLRDPVNEFHPLLNLAQAYAEDSDPQNYGHLFFKEPPPGQAPKSIYQSLGLIDTYTPVPNIKALAMAMGVQPVEPRLDEIEGLDLAGLSWGAAPVTQNVAGGQATGVVLEYHAKPGRDGHYVVFDIDDAVSQSNRFLATHSVSGIARLDPP